MRRIALGLVGIASSVLGSACNHQTEIVVHLSVVGEAPSSIVVKLHRLKPFSSDVPMLTPKYVLPALDGADLDLIVTPQGADTLFSLVPPEKPAPWDLTISASAPGGYMVTPSDAINIPFVDGVSQTAAFTLVAPTPDMAMPPARDLSVPRDMAHPG